MLQVTWPALTNQCAFFIVEMLWFLKIILTAVLIVTQLRLIVNTLLSSAGNFKYALWVLTLGRGFESFYRQSMKWWYKVPITCIDNMSTSQCHREPWSSGYGWRIMFEWSWVRILMDIFSHIFVVIIVLFIWKDRK